MSVFPVQAGCEVVRSMCVMSASTSFGAWLKQRRKSLDLTQDELARKVGCSTSLLQKIESGERRPSCQIVELLASALDITPDKYPTFVEFARADPSLSVRRPHLSPSNLLAPATPLIGREADVANVCQRLLREDTRLLTLIGSPGIGKTRLSVQVANQVRDQFDDGVFFVPLAPISDPDLVAPTIAHTLGLQAVPRVSPVDQINTYLADKTTLLVLDNFEQVIEAAPVVASLLNACPLVKVLVTSRSALRVRAERQFRVPPLAVPDPDRLPPLGQLSEFAGIALFVDRVQAVDPDFLLTETNAALVAAICHRLDGLPLAIELIAARTQVLSISALLTRLHGDLLLRADGLRDVDPRQHTLYNAIDWSYRLLSSDEQRLFAQLAVFVGDWTLEAVQAVCESDPFDRLASLVNKSLIVRHGSDDDVRFSMLEAIREYANERLTAQGEDSLMRHRHANYYLALAERAEPELYHHDQLKWLDRLKHELGNLRAALAWTLSQTEDQLDTGLRLASALWWFWVMAGILTEGREWLGKAVARSEGSAATLAQLRAHTLPRAAYLVLLSGDYHHAVALAERAASECMTLGDDEGLGRSLAVLGEAALAQGDMRLAEKSCEQSLASFQTVADPWNAVQVMNLLGEVYMITDKYRPAASMFESSLSLCEDLGDKWSSIRSLVLAGATAARWHGDFDRARALLEKAVALSRHMGSHFIVAYNLIPLGEILWQEGDFDQAKSAYEEALVLGREQGSKELMGRALEGLAITAWHLGRYARATQFLEESLNLWRETEYVQEIAMMQYDLAQVAALTGQRAKASALYAECLPVFEKLDDLSGITQSLRGLAILDTTEGNAIRAARVLGAEVALREGREIQIFPVDRAPYECTIESLRTQLGEEAFAAAWAEGRAMTLEQAIKHALTAIEASSSTE